MGWLSKRRAAALSVAFGLLALPPGAGATAGTFALQVTRSHAPYFVLSGTPGGVVSGEVTVLNVGGQAGGVSLYATDATTGQTSGAVYRSPQEPRRDVGAWIQLSQTHLVLAPRQSRVVSFRVVVPSGAGAGQHLGGIVASPDQLKTALSRKGGKAAFHVDVREIAVIAVQLTLPGPLVRRLAITRLQAGAEPHYQTLLLGLASTGTALTKGAGTITVTDSRGRQRLRQAFALDTFVPHTQIDYPVAVSGRALAAGHYTARITITTAGQRTTRLLPFQVTAKNLEQTFGAKPTAAPKAAGGGGSSSPVPLIVGGALVLVAGIGLGSRIRVRRPAKT